ncbi:DUF2069 domain-containing protein [Undibacterium jejuense]|uniref:DUF2069 domain-containing protein n=1 Tax=Undibacterium jejuense TaxID=1344949 RepID=A0A923HHN7_9BURK|nr:DUF2069 domain-containing protein [Undibacterium jejuense]MBC3862325.1 DUF2069 domain-containing protein [Undibacterium jejuense]
MITTRQQHAHFLACIILGLLIVLCISWEMWVAPLRTGGSWMALKVLPLVLPLRGVIRKDNYTMQWTSMLIWLYFTEGCVRAYSDKTSISAACASLEIFLSVCYFAAILVYLRPFKQAAKQRKIQNG